MLGARPRSGVSGVTLATGPGTAVVFNTLCASHFFECNWYENVDPEISHLRGAEFSHRGAEFLFFECNWYENADPEISHLRGAEFSHFRGAEISHRSIFTAFIRVFGRVGFFGGFFHDPFSLQKHFSGRIQDTHFHHHKAPSNRNPTSGLAYV